MKTQRSLIVVRVALALSQLVVLACCLAAPQTASAQSTADACRETKKVWDQYERELVEVRRLQRIKFDMGSFRDMLSSLRRSIANNAADRTSAYLWEFLGLGLGFPKTNKEQRELQPQIRAALEKAIQAARDTSVNDLSARDRRIENQINERRRRFIDLNCKEVLALEKSTSKEVKSGCEGFAGTWKTSFGEMSFTISGNSAGASYDFGVDAGKVQGTLSANGKVLSGTYSENEAKGTFRFTLSEDGQSFTGTWRRTSGKREPPSGTWEGKCIQE